MVICVKCKKTQSRRSDSVCPYDGNKKADPIHAWMEYELFFNELREKLFPYIRERIAEMQKKLANNKTLFNERMVPLDRKMDELKSAYNEYLNTGFPLDVKKKKQGAINSFFLEIIGWVIGVFVAFKWIFPMFSLKITDEPFFILAMIVLVGFFLGKSVLNIFKVRRYAESQNFVDELTHKWRNNNGFYEVESEIEAEKEKYNNIRNGFESRIYCAEHALFGSNEELLNFYEMDSQTKNYYIENIYDGAW